MSKIKLQNLLSAELGLERPIFKLERIGTKVAGSIISTTFRGKSDRARQQMIWKAIDAELGPLSVNQVGTLPAYTPEEWEVDLPAKVG